MGLLCDCDGYWKWDCLRIVWNYEGLLWTVVGYEATWIRVDFALVLGLTLGISIEANPHNTLRGL